MGRYIFRRLLGLIPVMFIISLITFFLMYLSPGDPAFIYLSQDGSVPTDEALAAMHEELGLDKPVWEQYGAWLAGVVQGDLGTSYFTGNPVAEEIVTYFPNTFKLALLGMALTLLISIPLGVFCATHENRFVDVLVRACSFVCGSLPGFLAAMLLIYVLGIQLKLLPTVSSGKAIGIVMPALALAITMSPSYIRQVRAAVLDEMSEGYVRMLRARGIKERWILYRNVLKSIMPSILTIAGLSMGQLLGGTAIIEIVCTYQGLGRLAVNSITNRDYPLMQGFVLMSATVYVLVNLLVDILHAASDPRVRKHLEREGKGGGSRVFKRTTETLIQDEESDRCRKAVSGLGVRRRDHARAGCDRAGVRNA